MSRRSIVLGIVLVVGVVASLALVLGSSPAAGPSALSPSADGWLAARKYLEARGARVTLLDHPFDPSTVAGALVMTFPCPRIPTDEDRDRLRRFLARGGTVFFAYSAERPGPAERLTSETLGLRIEAPDDDPPLSPRRWYAWATAEERLKADPSFSRELPDVTVHALRVTVAGPGGGQILYRDARGAPAIFLYAKGRGRVVALPADALSNGRLSAEGNADLLETLRRGLGADVAFDEYAHGLVAPDAAAGGGSASSLDLLVAQLVLLYGLTAWALARRFGPAWREPPTLASSTTGFLLGLGALHRDLGHSSEAAGRLIRNVEALDPRLVVGQGLRRATAGADETEFLAIARRIAKMQQGRMVRT
ncbi:MAG TPA: DUF4350 domain-containing protein [Thermoanaerobaculia bacterium]|nr:DUF4350 domain-containing protein [Thermoanaerobaculia bacterium]